MKKRLISIILVLACLLGTSVYATSFDIANDLYEHGENEAEGEVFYEIGKSSVDRKIKFMMDMGLIKQYIPTASAKRSDIKGFLELIKSGDIYSNYYGESASDSDVLTADEAIVILMDSAGYGPYIKLKNGNAGMYYTEALRRGLLKGVNYNSAKTKLTVKDFYTMAYNLLLIDTFETTFSSSEPTYNLSNVTIMESVLKLTLTEGIVKANSFTSLNGGAEAGENSIKIGTETYKSESIKNADDFLGYAVCAYYDDEKNICSLAVDDTRNDMKYFDCDADIKTDGNKNKFGYYDENGKLKELSLDAYADVIYNHVAHPGYTLADFDIDSGYIRLIDNNADGQYDVIFVYNYNSFCPKSKSENSKSITDKNGKVYDLTDILDDRYKGIVDSEGNELEFDDIKTSGGVSVLCQFGTNKVTEITVLKETTKEGVYSKQANIDGKEIYTIDDAEYKMAAAYSTEKNGKFPHQLGERVLIYLDMSGRIIRSASINDVLKYGYMWDLAINNNGFGNSIIVKMFTEDEQMVKYEFADKVNYNGVSVEKDKLISDSSTIYSTRREKLVEQLVRYQINSDGYITRLDTAKENHAQIGAYRNDESEFQINYDYEQQGNLYYNTGALGAFGGKYRVNSGTTKVFRIPDENDRDNENLFKVSRSELYNNNGYRCKIYDVDSDYDCGAVVITDGSRNDVWVSTGYSSAAVVISVGDVYDNKTEEVLKYVGVKLGNWETMYYADNTFLGSQIFTAEKDKQLNITDVTQIKKGYVIEVANDRVNRLIKLRPDCTPDYTKPLDSQTFEFTRSSDSLGKSHGVTETTFYGEDLIALGKIVRKCEDGFIFNAHSDNNFGDVQWNRRISCTQSQYVTCYDIDKDEISYITFADIEDGDFAFVQMVSGTLNTIVVYR